MVIIKFILFLMCTPCCASVGYRRKSAGVLLHRDSSWSVKKDALKVTLVSSPLAQGDRCFSLLSALSIVSTV